MSQCINAYYIQMWLDVINDAGGTPSIAVNTNHTSRKITFPEQYISPEGVFTANLGHYAISDLEINKQLGFISFTALYNGVSHAVCIPCEAIMCVMSKNPNMCAETFDELMIAQPEHGFYFELDSVHAYDDNSDAEGDSDEDSDEDSEEESVRRSKFKLYDMFTGKRI